MQKNIFNGVYPYLVSPVNADGSVKEDVLEKLVDHLINSGVHGLTPLGSTGEFAYLNWEQRKTVVETVIRSSGKRVPVVAGVFHASSREAAYQAATYEKMGADGILAIMDTYFPLERQQVVSYFAAIASAVEIPVVIYNNPGFLKTDISVDVVRELAEIPNILYIKDASANTGKLLTIKNSLGSKIDIFSASASIPMFVMMLGGVGWMAGPACVAPRESVALYDLAMAHEWDKAFELQAGLWEINRIFQEFNMAACMKAALELQGFPVGDPVPPLLPLSPDGRERVKTVLEGLGKLLS